MTNNIGTMLELVQRNLELKKEIDCLLKLIRHYDLADMRDDDVNKLLSDAKKGIFKMP